MVPINQSVPTAGPPNKAGFLILREGDSITTHIMHRPPDGYLLLESRRVIPARPVLRPTRGSAVETAKRLAEADVELPLFIIEQAQQELLIAR